MLVGSSELSQDASSEAVKGLASQVEVMRKVFIDANEVRERQRSLLEQRHAILANEILSLRSTVMAESDRLVSAIGQHKLEAEQELSTLSSGLLNELGTRFSETVSRLTELENRQADLARALEKEILDRKSETERVFGKLRDDLHATSDALMQENEIRKNSFRLLSKRLEDSSRSLNDSIEQERFTRDLKTVALRKQLDDDTRRSENSHKRVERYTQEIINGLTHAIKSETALRGATQIALVNSVTEFMKKFHENSNKEMGLN